MIPINKIWMALFMLLSSLMFFSCGDDSPGCPYCEDSLQPSPVVPSSADAKVLNMNWCAMEDAPSVINPGLMCEETYQNMLYRRHMRANGCVWTPQCKVILGSVFGPTSGYSLVSDVDVSAGVAGDVAINNNFSMTAEMVNLVTLCDNIWNQTPTGITIAGIRRFVYPNGNGSGVKGYGNPNGGIRPFLIICDPEFLGVSGSPNLPDQSTEQVLAHEIGHCLNLCHVDESGCSQAGNSSTTDNLMLANGSQYNQLLLVAQCNMARDNYPHLYNNSSAREITYLGDEGDKFQMNTDKSASELNQSLVIETDAGMQLLIGTKGLHQRSTSYWINFDADNDLSSGFEASQLISGGQQTGLDLAIQLTIDENGVPAEPVFFVNNRDGFRKVQVPVDMYKLERNTSHLSVTTDEDCISIPHSEVIDFELMREAYGLLNLRGEASQRFPHGAQVQLVSASPMVRGAAYDMCPNTPLLIE